MKWTNTGHGIFQHKNMQQGLFQEIEYENGHLTSISCKMSRDQTLLLQRQEHRLETHIQLHVCFTLQRASITYASNPAARKNLVANPRQPAAIQVQNTSTVPNLLIVSIRLFTGKLDIH